MKIGRNENCWCGSGKKYKACHQDFDDKILRYKAEGFEVPEHEIIKTPKQIEGIKKAGALNTAVLDMVSENIRIGMSTEEINTLVHEFTVKNGAKPATLGYMGFPKSCCTSINNVICHGIPSDEEILKDGDIINVDVTTILDGYYADASRMFLIGNVSDEARTLVESVKKAVDLSLEEAKPWGLLGNIGQVINDYAKKCGYSVLSDIGGHGVGNDFHEDPYVCHTAKRGTGMLLVPGMVFTIEPMINAGGEAFYQDAKNGWTIYTKDKSLSAQWEYTVLITDSGVEILTC